MKKAERLHKEKTVIKKRLRLVYRKDLHTRDVTGKTRHEHLQARPNSLNKNKPYDCGNSKCLVCHSEELFKKPRVKKVKDDKS